MGPFEPASAAAWIQWAEETFGELHPESAPGGSLSAEFVDDLRRYVDQWNPESCVGRDGLRWPAEIDPDQVEYLVHSFFSLDAQLSEEVRRGERTAASDPGRDFYLILVQALLHALETDSPCRAAFVDQLRSSWPIAAEAS